MIVDRDDMPLTTFKPPAWKRKYSIDTDILLRNHNSDHLFLKYNWVTLKLPLHSSIEIAILEEML